MSGVRTLTRRGWIAAAVAVAGAAFFKPKSAFIIVDGWVLRADDLG